MKSRHELRIRSKSRVWDADGVVMVYTGGDSAQGKEEGSCLGEAKNKLAGGSWRRIRSLVMGAHRITCTPTFDGEKEEQI